MIINESAKLNEAEEIQKYDLSGDNWTVEKYLDTIKETNDELYDDYKEVFNEALKVTGGTPTNFISLFADNMNNNSDFSKFDKYLKKGKKIKSIDNGFILVYTDGEFKYFFESVEGYGMSAWIPMAMYKKYSTR